MHARKQMELNKMSITIYLSPNVHDLHQEGIVHLISAKSNN